MEVCQFFLCRLHCQSVRREIVNKQHTLLFCPNPQKTDQRLSGQEQFLSSMVSCEVFSDQRYKCHSVYGKGGEDCLHQELSEKRCLSLQHCPRQAHDYYGDFPMSTSTTTTTLTSEHVSSFPALVHKGMCASWAESFAYADKDLEYGSNVADHHRLANEIVSQDRRLKQECRTIAFALAQCLRQQKLF